MVQVATDYILVGAGGHAAVVVEALSVRGLRCIAYVDQHQVDWVSSYDDAEHLTDDATAIQRYAKKGVDVYLGIGGIDEPGLEKRLRLLAKYHEAGFATPALSHASSVIGSNAVLSDGAMALAGSVVQPFANIGRGAIVNTRAVVEHHAVVGEGAHIAPGAIVLGGAKIGNRALVGANAVVLPGAVVPDGAIVKATERYH